MSKAPAPLTPQEKLLLLQASDAWRPWTSLQDQRRCIICDQTFSGRKVSVSFDRRGRPALHCPTPGCPSSPRAWLHPGDPLTDDEAWEDWLRIFGETDADMPLLFDLPVSKHAAALANFP